MIDQGFFPGLLKKQPGVCWSSSACDMGSRYTFFITSLVYAAACLVYVPLLYLVPRKEKEAAAVQPLVCNVPGQGGMPSLQWLKFNCRMVERINTHYIV